MSLSHCWNPCVYDLDSKSNTFQIVKSRGSYLYLSDGRKLLDATSSWWCKSLGHGHPTIKSAIIEQLNVFEHVLPANTTNDVIEKLSSRLVSLQPQLSKAFYASDGASAVEMALKMSWHLRQVSGETARNRFLVLENSYHGETMGALGVTSLSAFRHPYEGLLHQPIVIERCPYINSDTDPLDQSAELYWQRTEKMLSHVADQITALVIEPLLQGAAGMKRYSRDFLRRLVAWSNNNNIHVIADEIMTGMGRCGDRLASNIASIKPDMICLGKGLTAGFLPMSVVLASQPIVEGLCSDKKRPFLHSHTYSANALAASAALACMDVIDQENLVDNANIIGTKMHKIMTKAENIHGSIMNVRSLGAVCAADVCGENAHDTAQQLCQNALANGVLMRPLGSSIYWLPPLNITDSDLDVLSGCF
jgi:adenosylmethionine---8-amino-7-oxononanoate aminotransferase